jgi:5'(3')-deoxyribonucleotidase
MTVSSGRGNWKREKIRTHVHEIYVNSEDVGKELDAWLNENEFDYDILDIKVSSCHYRNMQTKTLVLIFYRHKQTDKKRLYFDMDNVLVDFKSGLDQVPDDVKARYADDGTGKPHYDDIPEIFSKMHPMPGAIEAVHKLAEKYDVYILSTAPWNNPSAWSDKLEWVKEYFGCVFYKRIILSHHKELNRGDYLIDDNEKNGANKFEGEWIHFGSERFPDWDAVLKYLLDEQK